MTYKQRCAQLDAHFAQLNSVNSMTYKQRCAQLDAHFAQLNSVNSMTYKQRCVQLDAHFAQLNSVSLEEQIEEARENLAFAEEHNDGEGIARFANDLGWLLWSLDEANS